MRETVVGLNLGRNVKGKWLGRALGKARGCKQEEKTVEIPKELRNENPRGERQGGKGVGWNHIAKEGTRSQRRCGLIQYGNEEVTGVIKAEARLQGVRERGAKGRTRR